jgi:hypothetical protein
MSSGSGMFGKSKQYSTNAAQPVDHYMKSKSLLSSSNVGAGSQMIAANQRVA